jgi:carbon starvation protein
MSEITGRYVNKRARTIFFLIAFLELLIVIAIFCWVVSFVFNRYDQAVFPIWMEIPIAFVLGLAVYKWKKNVALSTAVAVFAMYVTVVAGHWLPFKMPGATLGNFTLPAAGVWTAILLVYAFFASSIPVTTLLQPRDYINAWQLFIAMGLLIAGVAGAAAFGGLELVAPAYNASPAGAPPIWPFLMVVIACGAISGFHSLVASGTTPKQLRTEGDSLFVGYGSMLMEGALAVLVIAAVAGGIGMAYETKAGEMLTGQAAWRSHYASWAGAKGLGAKIDAVVIGSANMIATLGVPRSIAIIVIGVFIASFAGTTLDTATRLQRYVIGELGSELKAPALANRWTATIIAVVTAGALAFATGAGGAGALTLWPMFGAINQLLAALALLVVTLYLKRKHAWGWLLTLIPCLFMLVMTIWAVILNEKNFIATPPGPKFPVYQKWALVVVNALTLVLAVALVVEAFIVFFRPPKREALPEPS